MDDISQNIMDDRNEPYRPTRGDIIEWAEKTLREGLEPEPGARTHTDCPECGYRMVTGRETMGPEFDGFEDTLSHVRDMYLGEFTREEFRELARETFEEALDDVLDDEDGPDMDAEAHITLDDVGEL